MNRSAQLVTTITVLPVRCIAESTDWYRQALGFDTVYLHKGDDETEATNYAILRRGEVYVHLILDEPAPDKEAWTRAGSGYLYLIVRDVDAIYKEVVDSGVGVTRGIETEIWGPRAFNLADPSGNAIHVEANA